MAVEAAVARAQASHGVISAAAAREITRKASIEYAPLDEIAAANARLHHRMEALLYVWRKRLSNEARAALHYGTTTVDIYDTTLSLQISSSLGLIMKRNDRILAALADLAKAHRDTPMVGRTLGQHALAMTFGKKVAVWIGELDRHQERLCEARARLDRSMILKGPVGSYAGLGARAGEIEASFALELGKPAPYADDWHGARDVYAETAADIALLSRTVARFGQEIFLLQSTDIGEVREALPGGTVSSSSMPQKVNPAGSEALMHYGRTLPRMSEVILDDVVNFYERDNTSRPNALMGDLLIETENMLTEFEKLISNLEIDEDHMRANLLKSGSLLRSQGVVQALTPRIGREEAAREVKAAAEESYASGKPFLDTLMARAKLSSMIDRDELARLLDPFADLEGSAAQVDAVLAASEISRRRGCERN